MIMNEAIIRSSKAHNGCISKRGSCQQKHRRESLQPNGQNQKFLREHLISSITALEGGSHSSLEMCADLLLLCTKLNALSEGRRLHAIIWKAKLGRNIVVANKLINMYIECGSLIDAWNVFDGMPTRNVISWTLMIAGYTHHKCVAEAYQMFHMMITGDVTPNLITCLSLLRVRGGPIDLQKGALLHMYIVECGYYLNMKIATSLVDMYGLCGCVDDACHIFSQIVTLDVVLCTAMIHVYVQHGYRNKAMKLFRQMLYEGNELNQFTLSSMLLLCGNMKEYMLGKQVHLLILFLNIPVDRVIGTALVNMYAKCGDFINALRLFESMDKQDVVLWTAVLTGYAENGYMMDALRLFERMRIENIEPDIAVGNALIDLHFKNRDIENALWVFENMPKRNVISWSTLISGLIQQGNNVEALMMFDKMLVQGLVPDDHTFSSLVGACADIATSEVGKGLYSYIVEDRLENDTYIANAVINMYAKCGLLEDAHNLFDKVSKKNLIAWNSLMLGYGLHGQGWKALQIFQNALMTDMQPDQVTCSGILSTCSRLGMLTEGSEVYFCVVEIGLDGNTVVSNALIDMYAVCGSIEDATCVFNRMPEKTLISWSSLIGGCAQHGQGNDALYVFGKMFHGGMKPDTVVLCSLLTACSHAGLVKEGCRIFNFIFQELTFLLSMDFYAIMVDLLGRVGSLYEAEGFIHRMPVQPDVNVWRSLLGACCRHGHMELAEIVSEHVFTLEPHSAGSYVALSNAYAAFAIDDYEEIMMA